MPETVHSALFELAQGNTAFARNGISSTLLARIQVLGWHVVSSSTIADDYGIFMDFQPFLREH